MCILYDKSLDILLELHYVYFFWFINISRKNITLKQGKIHTWYWSKVHFYLHFLLFGINAKTNYFESFMCVNLMVVWNSSFERPVKVRWDRFQFKLSCWLYSSGEGEHFPKYLWKIVKTGFTFCTVKCLSDPSSELRFCPPTTIAYLWLTRYL